MTSKRKSKRYLIGFAGAILLPLSFYLFYDKDVRSSIDLPHFYRPQKVDSQLVDGKMEYDTTFHKVKEIQLTNQLGETVHLNKDLRGKILVINFFFANCSTICPQLTDHMAHAVKAYEKKNTDLVQFISISVDPKDSVPVLRQYADRFTSAHDRWWFLTGNKDSIFDYAKNELGLVLESDNPDDFIHSQQVVLVDTFRNVRGYFDGLSAESMSKCTDDIILLNLEKRRKK